MYAYKVCMYIHRYIFYVLYVRTVDLLTYVAAPLSNARPLNKARRRVSSLWVPTIFKSNYTYFCHKLLIFSYAIILYKSRRFCGTPIYLKTYQNIIDLFIIFTKNSFNWRR
jgi:hypothetical protein